MIRREQKLSTTTTGASFSECLKYRYTLWRTWGVGPMVNFVMLNPSTADDVTNDPTVERCQRRATALGMGGLIVTNLFAYRATDPKILRKVPSPISELATTKNDDAIRESASQCQMVICAWGNHGEMMGRSNAVVKLLRKHCDDKLHYLKMGGCGQPSHPLYLPYELKPVKWLAGT